jgi:hypothetical protein
MACLGEAERLLDRGSRSAACRELGEAVRLAGCVGDRDRARLDDVISALSARIEVAS